METINQAWDSIMDYLRRMEDIGEVAYDVWLSHIEPRSIENDNVVVYVHTDFQQKIITEHYASRICHAFEQVLGFPLGLKIISGEGGNGLTGNGTPDIHPLPEEGNLFDAQGDQNREYSFDQFVVGPSNKFAHAASQAVASKPSGAYNPLFIYGGSGLGKTHLLYAICNEISARYPHMRIMYTKGETLCNELIDAIRNHETAAFRGKYRQLDVLLVDDIQFIGGKESVQQEFFHTFDALHQAKKQIVLASDRPPKEIATLEDRLRNRFEMGLIADIQPPDLETRIAIIMRKADLMGLPLKNDVATYIADNLKSNVRQLEGVLQHMRARFLLEGEHPTRLAAQNAIRDIRNDNQPAVITVEHIINEVSRSMNVAPEDIRSVRRDGNIPKARQVAMYVVRNITNLSTSDIGREFGNRDHSSVVYSTNKVDERMKKDVSFKAMVTDIIKNIRND